MKQFNNIIKTLLIALLLITATTRLAAQSCCPNFEWQFNRMQCQTEDCKHNSTAGAPDASVMCRYSTNRITVTPAVPGFTYNWTVTGGTINNTLLSTLVTTVNYIDVVWGGGTTGYITVTIANSDSSCIQTLKQKFCLTAAPKPQFTINTTDTVCINQPITFTSTTLGAYTNLIWNFGDGTTQTGGNIVTHSYTTAGTYTVSLTATTVKDSMSCGCTNTFYYTIVVSNATGLSIYKPDCKRMHCAGDTVQYCASITGCSSYTWTANGGTVIGSGSCIRVVWNALVANPSVTVTIPTACAGTCGNSATFYEKILFNGMPISANPIMCVGTAQTIILPSLPGVFYQWSVTPAAGAVVNGANLNTPYFNATFPNAGTFVVTCNYQDSVIGCSGTSSFTVQVRPSYSITGSATSCETCTNTYATSPGVGNFNWTISPALGGFPVLNQPSVTITWPLFSANTYTLTATQVGSLYCNSPQIQNIIVAPKPVLTINSNINNICPGTPVKIWVTSNVTDVDIVWNTPGATILATLGNYRDTIVVVYNTCGPNTITATQDCKYTCTSTSVNIAINPPPNPVLATPINVNPCIDQTVTYTVANCIPGITYNWNISNNLGTITGGQGTCTITVLWHGNPGAGNAGVLTVSHCCGSVSANINVTVPPILAVSFAGSLCSGTVTATSNIATTSWSGTSTFSPSFGSTITISSAGTICATATVGSCTQTKCYVILPCGSGGGGGTPAPCTKPNATFSVNYNPTCVDGVVTFTAVSGYQNYFWDFGDGNISYLPNTTTHQYSTTGLVTATLIVDDYGCKDTFSLTIDVQPKPIVTIAPTPVIICPGTGTNLIASINPNGNTMCSSYNFQWMKDGVAISGAIGITYTATSYGIYTLGVTSATPSCNCTMTSNKAIVSEYEKPKANIETSSTICFTPPTAFFGLTATSYLGYTYNWSSSIPLTFSPNNSTFNFTSVNGTLTPNVPFQVYLEVVDSNGCKAYDTLCMYPFVNPTVSITSTGTLCANRLNILSVVSPNPNYVYNWNTGFVGTTYSTTTAGNYYTVATDMQSGCTAFSNFITINQTPFVELYPIGCDTMCDTSTLTIPLPQNPPLGAYTIQWYDGPKPAGTLLPYTGATIPLSGLGLGSHQLWAIISFSGSCPDSTGVFNLFIKKCTNCDCKPEFHFNGNPIVQPGVWQNNVFTSTGNPVTEGCSPNAGSLQCNTLYQIYHNFSNSYTAPCTGYDSAVIVKNGTTVVASNNNCSPANPIYYTFTTSGTYCIKHYLKIDGKICDSCVSCFVVNCPQACVCDSNFHFVGNPHVQEGEWIDNNFKAIGNPIKEPCGMMQAGSLQCNKPYSFYINFTNPYTAPCVGYDSAVIVKNGVTVVATNNNCSPANPLYYTFTASGTYCIKHYLKVNGNTCDSCITCFTVTCNPVCDCKNAIFLGGPSITWNVSKKGGGFVPYTIKGECNTSLAQQLGCGIPYNFGIGVEVSGGCPYTLVIELAPQGKPVIAMQTNNSTTTPLTYTFNADGIYCVTYKLYINGVLCKTCTLCFKVCCYTMPSNPVDIYGTAVACKIGAGTLLKHDSVGGTWYSNDTTIATVHPKTGYVTARAAGVVQIFYAYIKYPCGWHWVAIDYTVSLVDMPNATTLSAPVVCVGGTIQATNNTAIPQGGSSEWSIGGRGTVNNTGLITGQSAGSTYVRYSVINALGCRNYIDKAFDVTALPAVPSIGYSPNNTVNPQAGASGGSGVSLCNSRTFILRGKPSNGVWSVTGGLSFTQLTNNPSDVRMTTTTLGAATITYTVGATGCSNSRTINATVVTCATKGINNTNTKNIIYTVYPNPARNVINVSISTAITGSIILTDLLGKEIKKQAICFGANYIDVGSIAKGMYLVTVVSDNDKKVEKIIIEK